MYEGGASDGNQERCGSRSSRSSGRVAETSGARAPFHQATFALRCRANRLSSSNASRCASAKGRCVGVTAVYLLDTNVVSELRRTRPHGAVLQWLSEVEEADLHLSAVTLGEIQRGIEITRDQDADKAGEIEAWLELLTRSYNVIAMDSWTFRLWAKLMHGTSDTLYEDAMLAATAQVHRLIVVTRNVADFKSLGVKVLDPFKTPRR